MLKDHNAVTPVRRYDSFQLANNKGADQTAHMGRLVCTFVVRKPRRQIFSRRGPYGTHLVQVGSSSVVSVLESSTELLLGSG